MQRKGSRGPTSLPWQSQLRWEGPHSSALGPESLPGRPFTEEAGRFRCFWGSAVQVLGPDVSLRPGAPPSPLVTSTGFMRLIPSEGHRMGSEPFQFTDAPST